MHAKKEVLSCKFSIIFVCFRVFFHLQCIIESTVSPNISIFPLNIRVKSSFSHPVFGRSGWRLSNSTHLEMAKSGKNPTCSFFSITKSTVEPKDENTRTIYVTKGKIFNFFILIGAYRNLYANLN